MGTSKNDFDFYAGRARITAHPHQKQYEAKFMLLHPERNVPCTYFELYMILKKRQEENPQLSVLAESWIKKLQPTAGAHPTRVFAMYAQGKDQQTAKAQVRKVRWEEMASLAKLIFRPLFAQNLASGHITVKQYVEYQEDSLFNDDLPAVRTRLMGCLKKLCPSCTWRCQAEGSEQRTAGESSACYQPHAAQAKEQKRLMRLCAAGLQRSSAGY